MKSVEKKLNKISIVYSNHWCDCMAVASFIMMQGLTQNFISYIHYTTTIW